MKTIYAMHTSIWPRRAVTLPKAGPINKPSSITPTLTHTVNVYDFYNRMAFIRSVPFPRHRAYQLSGRRNCNHHILLLIYNNIFHHPRLKQVFSCFSKGKQAVSTELLCPTFRLKHTGALLFVNMFLFGGMALFYQPIWKTKTSQTNRPPPQMQNGAGINDIDCQTGQKT